MLEAKLLPCKEGEGSEPEGPKLCLFAQQRHAGSVESGRSCAGALWAHGAPAALPAAGAQCTQCCNAHTPAAPLLSHGTINATVDKNRSHLSGAEGWLVSILPSIHCSWIAAKESVVRSALQRCSSCCWPSYRAHSDCSPGGTCPAGSRVP